MKKFYITTPLYYVNSKPHIGHAYTQVACDAVARYMRTAGREVFFMTGTDEHGEKIEKTTIERGFKPGEEKRFVDGIVPSFKAAWKALDITHDYFIRTTDESHIKTVQHILEVLYKKGMIYKKTYQGWFCTPCETFWTETQSPDGICPECKRPLERLDEANYFFKTSAYQAWLIDHIKSHPDFIRPDFRRNEVLGFLTNETLLDLCISRPKTRMSWGVEVPFDKDYVTYVWFDALINYISGAGYPDDPKKMAELWPCDFHVMGKDIIRHHAVYWPIMLKALDIEPPKSIFAHGWWVMKGEKMSKSKGNVVDPLDLIAKYGVDAFRYFLLREVAFGLDGSFSEEAFVTRFNNDLANDLGNLVSRSLSMVEKYFGGVVPTLVKPLTSFGVNPDRTQKDLGLRIAIGGELVKKTEALMGELANAMPNFDFANALTKIWEVIGIANKYIEEAKPWTLAKEEKTAELATVMRDLLEALRVIAFAIAPVMPATAQSIWKQLGFTQDIGSLTLSSFANAPLKEGMKLAKSAPLFPRIETK